jgi:rare lipoprotein A
MNYFRSLLFSLFVLGLLGACAETTFLAHVAKEIQISLGLNDKSGKIIYKVGKPYEIDGVWYYPKVDYKYVETGIASWYGPNFHRKKTANGETFDMNGVSAAHRTLPMPSLVRITNLNSGRSINVRVNDRGPFAHGRIIDLSRRAAQLLGFERAGTVPVRVEILAEESRQLAAAAQNLNARTPRIEPKKPDSVPTVSVTSATLPPPIGAKAAEPTSEQFKVSPVTQGPLKIGRSKPTLAIVDEKVTPGTVTKKPMIFVQAGAFSRYQDAHKARAVLKQLGPTEIKQININQRTLFRFRIGPLGTVQSADQILRNVIKAGYPNAATIVE